MKLPFLPSSVGKGVGVVLTTKAAAVVALSLAGVFLAGGHASAAEAAVSASSAPDGDCYRVESERFVFHSDPWINLHHFLFQWARDVSPRQPGDRRRAVEVSERTELGDLDEGEQEVWERSVDIYGERIVPANLLFDRSLIALRGQLAAISCSAAGPEDIDTELRPVLTDAMPVYRQHWWPEHHATNKTWIQSRLKDLTLYEATLATRLAAAYGGEWPRERIRVDVSAYANWAGAYTTNHPNHVTVSSTDYESLEGLEILFHEVSHASFFEQPILGQLAAAFRGHEAATPDGLSHVIQFVTPAELLRSLLSPEERARVQLVADRMAQRRRSRDQYRVVLGHWRPFLEGQVERAEALDQIAVELVSPRQQVQPLPRWLHAAAVVNGKIYVMGGVGADNQPVASVEAYDPAAGSWSECASMPTARALFGAAVVGGTIYAIGGTTMGPDKLAVVEAYDPATDTWSRKTDMPTPRNSLSAVAVDGKIYAIGGWGFDRPDDGWESVDLTAAAAFSTVEVYDPETDTWVGARDMPTPRGPMTVSALDGKIYVIGGGARRGGQDVALSVVEVYDPAANRWAAAVDMPTPRIAPSSSVIEGRIHVTGGVTTQGPASTQLERERSRIPLSVVEVYDPADGRWTTDTDLALPRGWHSTSVVDGKLYVVGGRSLAPDGAILEVDGAIPGIEVYTPTW